MYTTARPRGKPEGRTTQWRRVYRIARVDGKDAKNQLLGSQDTNMCWVRVGKRRNCIVCPFLSLSQEVGSRGHPITLRLSPSTLGTNQRFEIQIRIVRLPTPRPGAIWAAVSRWPV